MKHDVWFTIIVLLSLVSVLFAGGFLVSYLALESDYKSERDALRERVETTTELLSACIGDSVNVVSLKRENQGVIYYRLRLDNGRAMRWVEMPDSQTWQWDTTKGADE